MKNPHTIEEHEQMLNDGLWTEDGFVGERAAVAIDTIIQDGRGWETAHLRPDLNGKKTKK